MTNALKKIKKSVARDELINVVKMEWGGDRNLALRAWLGSYESEVAMINMAGILQTLAATKPRATALSKRLNAAIPREQIYVQKNDDGKFLIWCDINRLAN